MIKITILIVFLSFGVTFNSYAEDTARIDQLQREVQELKLRVSKLESMLIGVNGFKELIPSHKGWKSISNWRKLSPSMFYDDVEKVLGKPQRIDGGNNIARWHYKNGGNVTFMHGSVHTWSEPRW